MEPPPRWDARKIEPVGQQVPALPEAFEGRTLKEMQKELRSALNLAIKVIDKEIKDTNIQANLYEIFEMKSGRSAWEYRERLRKARQVISDHKNGSV